jgi:hypothetical protein
MKVLLLPFRELRWNAGVAQPVSREPKSTQPLGAGQGFSQQRHPDSLVAVVRAHIACQIQVGERMRLWQRSCDHTHAF